MPSLIGNKPNQVSTNGDLGTMAFREQDQFYPTTQSLGFKNRIINGAMTIDQRNAGASVTNTGSTTFYLDRWNVLGTTSAGQFSIQQDSTAPAGFNKSVKFTVTTTDASLASGDRYIWMQRIEGNNIADLGFGTANASTVTISFWIRSSVTGTFGGSLNNGDGNRSYVFTYSISAANTWEQKTVTITGDTTGTWPTDNSRAMQINFSLGAGSDYQGTASTWAAAGNYTVSGATNLMATSGATFYITGVQLEKGSTATSFDYRPYGTELQLCQRYYYQYVNGNNQSIGIGTYYNSTQLYSVIQIPVTMRAKPTLSSTTGTDFYSIYRNGGSDSFNSLALDGYEHTNGAVIRNTAEVSGTAGQSGFITTISSSGALALSAEL